MKASQGELTSWRSVLSKSLGKILVSQTRCADLVVEGRSWKVDLAKGILVFGDDEYPAQLIGTEAYEQNTWLWSWSEQTDAPESLLEIAKEVRTFGAKNQIEPLISEQFSLTESENGHTLSTVACAQSERKLCYYRCPDETKAAFVAFEEAPDEVFEPAVREELIRVALEGVKSFVIDHRIFVESLLEHNGISFTWDDTSLIAHFDEDCRFFFVQEDSQWHLDEIKPRVKGGE